MLPAAMRFEDYKVERAPPSAYYIENFITEEEEQRLIQEIYAAPKPKWKELSHRRLQNWGGLPHPRGMVAEHIPKWLQHHMDRITTLGAFKEGRPNHVLVNEYLPGQGIMPHEDGPMFYPTITTITLSSHTLLDLYTPRPPDTPEEEEEEEDGKREERKKGEEERGNWEGKEKKRNEGERKNWEKTEEEKREKRKKSEEEGEILEKKKKQEKNEESMELSKNSSPSPSSPSSSPPLDEGKKEKHKQENRQDTTSKHHNVHHHHASPLQNRYIGSLLLAPRSLLIVQDALYTSHLHGIAEVTEDVVSDDILNLPRRGEEEEEEEGVKKEERVEGEEPRRGKETGEKESEEDDKEVEGREREEKVEGEEEEGKAEEVVDKQQLQQQQQKHQGEEDKIEGIQKQEKDKNEIQQQQRQQQQQRLQQNNQHQAYLPGHTLTRGTRISLTIRHVPKVLKNKLWLGRGQR